jgi:hypothetical protein
VNSLYQRLALLLLGIAVMLGGLALGSGDVRLGVSLLVIALLFFHCRRLEGGLTVALSQRDAVKSRMDALLERIAQAKALAQNKTGPRLVSLDQAAEEAGVPLPGATRIIH